LCYKNLTTKDVKAVRTNFMRFYKDRSLNLTEELEQAAEHNKHQQFVVSNLLDLRYYEKKR
jgi:hypothetical protein